VKNELREGVTLRSSLTLASETLAAVNALSAVADRLLPRSMALPDELATAKVLRNIGAADSSPASPPGDFLAKLRQRLVVVSRARQIAGLSRKELRYTPWLLWNGDPPAASLPGLLPLILDQARTSGATLRRLIQAYLRDFSSLASGISEAAACIRQQLTNTDLRLEHWRIAQDEVQLFDAEKGPASLATRLLDEKDPDSILSRYKLDDPMLATGGYMMAVEDAVRGATPVKLRDGGTVALERVLKIIAPTENRLRFGSRRAETARAFLNAWFTGRGEPVSALQEPVRRHLLHWLGDPRLRPQPWAAVGEQETALMRRWLARASLDLFFRLIDQHTSGVHWPYRRAFWFAYLEKGAIGDAWLALGTEAYNSARAVRELGGAYGRLLGDSRQSALLLRLGPLVIGEFTHIGKVRAWLADHREAPDLGRQEYPKSELMRECLPFPENPYRRRGGNSRGTGLSHFQSREGYWQGSAAALIERHTGTRITALDWRPR
jgi:EH_Signature domain